MSVEREKLDERYLQAHLREELGNDVDLSEGVMSQYFAKHAPARRAIIPAPRRRSVWRPLVSAACVLIAAGVTVWALVSYLPGNQRHVDLSSDDTAESIPVDTSERDDKPPVKDQVDRETPAESESETPPASEKKGEDLLKRRPKVVVEPEKPTDKPVEGGGEKPSGEVEKPDYPPDWTDPPEAFPEPDKPEPWDDPTEVVAKDVLVTSWKGEDLRVTRGTQLKREKVDPGFELISGDMLEARKPVDFVLVDGSILRLDGDMTVIGSKKEVGVELSDGAVYVRGDGLKVLHEGLIAYVHGTSVIEQRLRSLDVFCVSGWVTDARDKLNAGNGARLEEDGFGRTTPTTWKDVAKEFRFLEDIRGEVIWREDLDEAPGKLFGGEILDGLLKGESDPGIGTGFYLREPHQINANDIVRVRLKLDASTKLVLQFGSMENANWRHEMGNVKAGEWIEFELPLSELVKTTDHSVSARSGLRLKFFQLHPEDDAVGIEIDWVEVLREYK